MDWYFVPAFLIAFVTTLVFIGGCIAFALEKFDGYSSERKLREYARQVLMVLWGYVLAVLWPVAIPLAAIIGIGYLIKTAFPQTDKENK